MSPAGGTMRAEALTAYWPGWHAALLKVEAVLVPFLTVELVRGLLGSIGVEWITSCPRRIWGTSSEHQTSAKNSMSPKLPSRLLYRVVGSCAVTVHVTVPESQPPPSPYAGAAPGLCTAHGWITLGPVRLAGRMVMVA